MLVGHRMNERMKMLPPLKMSAKIWYMGHSTKGKEFLSHA